MEAIEIFNKFDKFVVDTYEKKITILKRDELLVKIVEWKDKSKQKELYYPFKSEVISFINDHKILLQVR